MCLIKNLCKMEDYDERIIKNSLNFIGFKNLHNERIYLHF
ncbi:hypothetical protein Q7M_1156 (plasmid) [Borrelia crocidurae str. Achema]|uniref:Uncharacterized protein n=1 Tax=Borrelia crocidurae (strain Achema) TaxID=1155096 RepID=I0FF98_BORCA|nr:hypothetical protein Q7M_1156 [Borrelia crocidurae str. Achema]